MGMDLASFHSFDEGMAVMEVLWKSQTADNIWLGLIRNINGMKYIYCLVEGLTKHKQSVVLRTTGFACQHIRKIKLR